MARRNQEQYTYEPRSYDHSRQDQPESFPQSQPDQTRDEVHGMELPLIRNGEVLGMPGEVLGHPCIKLKFSTQPLTPQPLELIEQGGLPVTRVAVDVAFYIQGGTDPYRVLERKIEVEVESYPDVVEARKRYEELQERLEAAEQENLVFWRSIPEYAAKRVALQAAEKIIEDLKRSKHSNTYRDNNRLAKQLKRELNQLQKDNEPPNNRRRLTREVDQAWWNLEGIRNRHWQGLDSKVMKYFHKERVKIDNAAARIIAKALQNDGRGCAVYELGERRISPATNRTGAPKDVSKESIDVSFDTIVAALQPQSANKWYREPSKSSCSFAYFPTTDRKPHDGSLSDYVDKNVGDGIVGLQFENRIIVILFRKSALVDVLFSEEYYRAEGTVDRLLKVAGGIPRYVPKRREAEPEPEPEPAADVPRQQEALVEESGAEPEGVAPRVEADASENDANANTEEPVAVPLEGDNPNEAVPDVQL